MSDLKGVFEEQGDHGLYAYKHKHEKELIEAAKKELAKTSTGSYQVRIVEVQDIKLGVLKSTEQIKLVPDGQHVYVSAPAGLKKPNAEFILDLSVGIREAEQKLLGLTVTDKKQDPKEHQLSYHSLQLDLIVQMFKICDEMQKTNDSEVFLDIVNNYGYSNLHKLYEQNVSHEEMADLYLKMAKEQEEKKR